MASTASPDNIKNSCVWDPLADDELDMPTLLEVWEVADIFELASWSHFCEAKIMYVRWSPLHALLG